MEICVIVDDDDDFVASASELVRAIGLHPVGVRSRLDALELLLQIGEPGAVLVDYYLGDETSIELLTDLRDRYPTLPLFGVTVSNDPSIQIEVLNAGADDFLTKPLELDVFRARVLSGVNRRGLERSLFAANQELQRLSDERGAQVSELRRFFSPQVADMIATQGVNGLDTHRSEIAALFFDMRNFTTFSDRHEPERQIRVIREYHDALAPLVEKYDATVAGFQGDGVLLLFGDPVPVADPVHRAVRLCSEFFRALHPVHAQWAALGYDLGVGTGLAFDFATLGVIGFPYRREYTPIGSVVNRAARLCGKAKHGSLLLDPEAYSLVSAEFNGTKVHLALKGLADDVSAYEIRFVD